MRGDDERCECERCEDVLTQETAEEAEAAAGGCRAKNKHPT